MDTSHLLSVEFQPLPCGQRYTYPKIRINQAKNEFIPREITQLNRACDLLGVWGNIWARGCKMVTTNFYDNC